MVTPFRADLSIDMGAFTRLCRHLSTHGSDGLVVAGTTGEGPTLEDDEKLELFSAARDAASGVRILAGTGSASTAHAIRLTERANAIGVDGMLVVVPYYNRPPTRGIVRHFQAVAAATDRPIMVYNIPQRTGVALDRVALVGLSEIPNVTAIKQSDPDADLARFIVEETTLELYAGNDDLVIPFTQIGAVGGVFVFSHLVGDAVGEIIRLVKAGDVDSAERVFARALPALEAVEAAPNPIAVKAALEQLGLAPAVVRPPLDAATPNEVGRIAACLERAGLHTASLQPHAS